MCCCKGEISLDTPKGNRPMCKDFLKGNELVPKGRSESDKEKCTKEAVMKAQA